MKVLLLILTLLLPIPASSQVQPFLQGSIGADSTGYSKPVLAINTGLDIALRRFTSITTLDLEPAVAKSAVKGLGYSVGGTSLNYWRVYRFISVGGGASGLTLRTVAWEKSSVFGIAGVLLDNKRAGRLYLNYYRAVALDQNHLNELKATAELGHGRFRPVVALGLEHFTEPSYCRGTCTGLVNVSLFVGGKIMLGRSR